MGVKSGHPALLIVGQQAPTLILPLLCGRTLPTCKCMFAPISSSLAWILTASMSVSGVRDRTIHSTAAFTSTKCCLPAVLPAHYDGMLTVVVTEPHSACSHPCSQTGGRIVGQRHFLHQLLAGCLSPTSCKACSLESANKNDVQLVHAGCAICHPSFPTPMGDPPTTPPSPPFRVVGCPIS